MWYRIAQTGIGGTAIDAEQVLSDSPKKRPYQMKVMTTLEAQLADNRDEKDPSTHSTMSSTEDIRGNVTLRGEQPLAYMSGKGWQGYQNRPSTFTLQ